MPNWCENELRVIGRKADVERFIGFVAGSRDDQTDFDFDRIVPYPEDYGAADAALRKWEEDNKGMPWNERTGRPQDGYNQGGYEWCIANWGTKWNACDTVVRKTSRGCTFSFNTAWSPPGPVIRKAASLFPSLQFDLKYWEGGCGFQGGLSVKCEEVLEEWEGEYRGRRGG